ncbi:prenyl diphosphate phosphatase [Coprinopsis sp. MPI-PUGE-AT-0042]|nr:prenyl diphosphate phosphatase [Coprinopsis sp. MPI-PUGE-AT-0042]
MATARTDNTHVANHTAATHSSRPPFTMGSWFKRHGFDILSLAVMGAIALGVHFAGPAPSRSFSIYNLDGGLFDRDISWPYRKNIIPLYAAVLLSVFVPILFFALFQIRRKSIDDFMTTTLGLMRGIITAALFQVFVKWLIGGLRPHFLAVCQPNIPVGAVEGGGFSGVMYDRSICTGDPARIDEAMQSMPSGHATAAWAGFTYLALYFNAQLKVMAAHNPAYWKMIMFFAPLLGAFLVSATLTIDKHHHWYDLIVGGLIGTACAFIAFRQTFAAIWDYRFNHILVPKTSSLFARKAALHFDAPYFTYQPSYDGHSQDLPFSREGGWNDASAGANGAPGDATALASAFSGHGLGSTMGNRHHAFGAAKDTFGTGTTSSDPRTSNVGHVPFGNAGTTTHHSPLGNGGVTGTTANHHQAPLTGLHGTTGTTTSGNHVV